MNGSQVNPNRDLGEEWVRLHREWMAKLEYDVELSKLLQWLWPLLTAPQATYAAQTIAKDAGIA